MADMMSGVHEGVLDGALAIVTAHVRHNKVEREDVTEMVREVYETLLGIHPERMQAIRIPSSRPSLPKPPAAPLLWSARPALPPPPVQRDPEPVQDLTPVARETVAPVKLEIVAESVVEHPASLRSVRAVERPVRKAKAQTRKVSTKSRPSRPPVSSAPAQQDMIERLEAPVVSVEPTDAAIDVVGAGPVPAVPIETSVRPDHIVCLEDGEKVTDLKRHLKVNHGMTPEEYRKRWNLPDAYPMVAAERMKNRSRFTQLMGQNTASAADVDRLIR
jgi:predicted transcriptional regulator